ncbi:MAG: tRNA dihydrouridine synthase DusB [Halanaerobiales bacterium]
MLSIDGINIDNPVILAPMAGVSDYPYRQIAREMGIKFLYTEMISSKGLVYGNVRTKEMIDFDRRGEGLIAVQIFGEEPSIMAEAAVIVEREFGPDFIDLNMGCPVPKVVKTGAGSALMKEPELAGKIIHAVVQAVDIPVLVKIRKGWNGKTITGVEVALEAERNGAAAVAVHGRTRDQYYSGEADWNFIGRVSEKIGLPVIGNGDIFSPEDAAEMMETGNCEAVMIGRGARGNPWLLKNTAAYLMAGKKGQKPTRKQRINMALYHLRLAVDYYGEETAIPRMRKHISWYLKGISYSARVKEEVYNLKTYREVRTTLEKFKHQVEV